MTATKKSENPKPKEPFLEDLYAALAELDRRLKLCEEAFEKRKQAQESDLEDRDDKARLKGLNAVRLRTTVKNAEDN